MNLEQTMAQGMESQTPIVAADVGGEGGIDEGEIGIAAGTGYLRQKKPEQRAERRDDDVDGASLLHAPWQRDQDILPTCGEPERFKR